MSSFRLTDCHAHLADAVFDSDREVVLRRAAAVGVAGSADSTGGSTSTSYRIRVSTLSASRRDVLQEMPTTITFFPMVRRALTTWMKSESPDTST